MNRTLIYSLFFSEGNKQRHQISGIVSFPLTECAFERKVRKRSSVTSVSPYDAVDPDDESASARVK